MISRRRSLMMLGAGLLLGPDIVVAQATGAARIQVLRTWPLGLQLWTINEQLKQDFRGSLNRIKAAGYDVVETAGLLGRSAKQFRRSLDDAGLVCGGSHFSMADLLEDVAAKIDVAKTLGATWLVCASPKLPSAPAPGQDWLVAMRDGMTLDGWKANAESLAMIAPAVKRAGLKLAYHNHFMEFFDHGGVTGFDTLLAAVDASLLRVELDIGWVRVAGRNPMAILKAHADRVDLLHVKDMIADSTAPIGFRSVEVGKGLIEWPKLLSAARAQGVSGMFVEQEAPFQRDIFTSLTKSRDYLRSID